MRRFSLLALGAALLPLVSPAFADECPIAAAAKKAQAAQHVQTVAHKADAKDIVDTAVGAGSFKTLVAAVQAAGLVETLKGEGPFTVFAPTDEAFAKLPAGTVESLLKPENKDKLVAVLTYHVVPGTYTSADLKNGQKLKTVEGQDLTVTVKDGTVKVNDATVEKADIEASNGVVHIINGVLVPPAN
ncbi:MAG: fasciclin domain-containing protein [Solirubrobacterales bacterium]